MKTNTTTKQEAKTPKSTTDKFKCRRQLIRAASLLISAVLLFLLALLGCYITSISAGCPRLWLAVGRVITALAILGGGWIVIVLSHQKMQSSRFKIGAFLVVFSYGIAVYSIEGLLYADWVSNSIASINSTLSMFFPSRGGYEKGFDGISMLYTSVHLLSYLYIAMLGVSLFGRRVMNRSLNSFTRPKHKNIFWGYSDGGVLLAKDIMSKTLSDKAVFVMPQNMPLSSEMERYRFEEIDGIGGVVLYKDFTKDIINIKAARHFFLTEDQDLNVKLAFMTLRAIEQQGAKAIPTELYVRTELAHVDSYFTKALKSLGGMVEVHTINESELTARRFIDKYPPLEMPNITIDPTTAMVEGNFNILQLGYGWSGKAILNKMICNTQFAGSTFSATVFDKDLETNHGFYPLLDEKCFGAPGAVNSYNITTECNTSIGSIEFKKWIEEKIYLADGTINFNRIIVALGDDTLNVRIALAIAKVFNSKGMSYKESSKYIFAHIRNTDCCTYFELDETPISVFGNKDKIYTMEIIVNDELDKLAIALNAIYDRSGTDAVKLWGDTCVFSQESSRAAAIAVENTLRLRGMKMVPQSEEVTPVEWKLSKNILELLSENEHRRWNAFHFTQGIKAWSVPPKEGYAFFKGGKPIPKQIETNNCHAALVEYKELPRIDDIFNPWVLKYNKKVAFGYPKPFKAVSVPIDVKTLEHDKELASKIGLMNISHLQESDRKFVRDLDDVLGGIGYKIVKLK